MSGKAAGLYLHLPFCYRVCPYCDFAVRLGGREKRARFVETLVRDKGLFSFEKRRNEFELLAKLKLHVNRQ